MTATPEDPAGATAGPLVELDDVSKFYGNIKALEHVSLEVHAGEITCVLGDNGAGKSTLIKIIAGLHRHDAGRFLIDGEETTLANPRDALDRGIATVYQDLAVVPLMPVWRNFFLGSEPTVGVGPFKRLDVRRMRGTTRTELLRMGIDLRDVDQPIGTLSGGERQCVAIARAVYFGAKVLVLDEPTAALGVKQSGVVLKYVAAARDSRPRRGPHHAQPPPRPPRRRPLHPPQARRDVRQPHQGRRHAGRADPADGGRQRAGGAQPRAGTHPDPHPPGRPRHEGRDSLSGDRPGAADPAHRPPGPGSGRIEPGGRRPPPAATAARPPDPAGTMSTYRDFAHRGSARATVLKTVGTKERRSHLTAPRVPTVGIDIGGTKVMAGVVDADGNILEQLRTETPDKSKSPKVVEDTIVELVLDLSDRHDVHAVGIGAAGWVDADRSKVLFAPHLAWRDEPLRDAIASRLVVPVMVDNDANTAAWAEWRFERAAARTTSS